MRVIAFDPGGTTGWATADLMVTATKFTVRLQGDGEFRFPEGLRELLPYANRCDVVIAEDFIPRQPLIGDRLIAVRVLGGIQTFVQEDKLVLQTPLQKSNISDTLLESYRLRNSSAHILDAYRHIIVFALREMTDARKSEGVHGKACNTGAGR